MSKIADVDIILERYKGERINGKLSALDAVRKLYKYWPECEPILQDEAPELIDIMDIYIDCILTSHEGQTMY